MKLSRVAGPAAALALSFAASAHAAPTPFFINFEKSWSDSDGDINGYYNGGTAADGTTGTNLGVAFSNISGLSNVDPASPFYANAPSPLGVAYPHAFLSTDAAIMNVANGVAGVLSFFYSSPSAIAGAVRAYTGQNGTGTLLGTLALAANDTSTYDRWTPVNFTFAGIAQSFDFTGGANVLAFDNLRGGAFAVPEPGLVALGFAGAAAGLASRRRRR